MRQIVQEGRELTREARYGYGLGWAQWVLGRIAMASRRREDARRELEEALKTFDSIGARFMAARVHLTLGEVARARGDQAGATRQSGQALDAFRALKVPLYERKVLALASASGVPIPWTSAEGSRAKTGRQRTSFAGQQWPKIDRSMVEQPPIRVQPSPA